MIEIFSSMLDGGEQMTNPLFGILLFPVVFDLVRVIFTPHQREDVLEAAAGEISSLINVVVYSRRPRSPLPHFTEATFDNIGHTSSYTAKTASGRSPTHLIEVDERLPPCPGRNTGLHNARSVTITIRLSGRSYQDRHWLLWHREVRLCHRLGWGFCGHVIRCHCDLLF